MLRRSILLVIPIISGIVLMSSLFLVAHAQETSPVQQVTKSGITMKFWFSPSSPKINDYTTLMFSMTNATTGKQVQNYVGSITIGNVAGFTGGSGYYNFSQIIVPNGNFSVNYAFPNDGTFPVFFRADHPTSISGSSGLITVGVFQVFVPAQTPPIDNTMIYVGIVVAAGVIGGTVIFMKRKNLPVSDYQI